MKIIFFVSSVYLFSSCLDKKEYCIHETKINPGAGCLTYYAPVCGCDGKTYSNDCHAKNAGVTNYVSGECQK